MIFVVWTKSQKIMVGPMDCGAPNCVDIRGTLPVCPVQLS